MPYEKLGSAEIQTWGSWVRSTNATSMQFHSNGEKVFTKLYWQGLNGPRYHLQTFPFIFVLSRSNCLIVFYLENFQSILRGTNARNQVSAIETVLFTLRGHVNCMM